MRSALPPVILHVTPQHNRHKRQQAHLRLRPHLRLRLGLRATPRKSRRRSPLRCHLLDPQRSRRPVRRRGHQLLQPLTQRLARPTHQVLVQQRSRQLRQASAQPIHRRHCRQELRAPPRQNCQVAPVASLRVDLRQAHHEIRRLRHRQDLHASHHRRHQVVRHERHQLVQRAILRQGLLRDLHAIQLASLRRAPAASQLRSHHTAQATGQRQALPLYQLRCPQEELMSLLGGHRESRRLGRQRILQGSLQKISLCRARNHARN
jgi:hypothetical protein